MRKNLLFGEGVTGVKVELDNTDLIVLKGFVERAQKYFDGNKRNALFGESKELLQDAAQFFTNILPEEVMSLEASYKNLFGKPEEETKAENEL